MKKTLIFSIAIFILTVAAAAADIKGDIKSGLSISQVLSKNLGKKPADETISAVVGEMVTDGMDAGQVVAAAIKLGYNPKAVIIAATAAGGAVNSIVNAALSNGVGADDCSEFCIAGGADPDLVSNTVAAALGEGIEVSAGGPTDTGNTGNNFMIPAGGGGGGGTSLSTNK